MADLLTRSMHDLLGPRTEVSRRPHLSHLLACFIDIANHSLLFLGIAKAGSKADQLRFIPFASDETVL